MELLFESRLEIASVEGKVNFFQTSPTVHPEPVVPPDSFVDGAGTSLYGTVLRDGGRFRMWYQSWPKDWDGGDVDLVSYAESEDGLHWSKPRLGLVAYGPEPNNLCTLGFHCPSVFIDPAAPASHRYRATGFTAPGRKGARQQVKEHGYYTAHSADGLNWELDRLEPQWRSGDVISSIYHPAQRRGIVALKFSPRVGGFGRRCIWNAELVDGQWSAAHSALLPDEFDDICAIARGFASGDYYGMGMMPAGRGTVGFLWNFRHSLPRTAGAGFGVFGATDVSLLYQADRGERWVHAYGRPDFIAHTAVPWAAGGVYTASCAIDVGDEQWLYFCGALQTHGWYVDEHWRVQPELLERSIEQTISKIGVARWPKDRLFGFRADPRGVVHLNLGARGEACELLLNFRTDAGGTVRVELPGREGYALDDAAALQGDCLTRAAAWRKGTAIAGARGSPLAARIHLDRAELYAYDVRPVNP